MEHKTPTVFLRFVKHTLFSLLGTATDTLVLWIFSDFILTSYVGACIISPIISFECGNVVNFFVSSRFVWNDRLVGEKRKNLFFRFIAFNLSYTTVLLIKTGLLLGIEAISGWDVVPCNVIALTIAGFVNFAMNNHFIFKVKNNEEETVEVEEA